MPEMWAFCGPCDRWFYVPFGTGEEMAGSRCPVCACPPSRYEVRTPESSFEVTINEVQSGHRLAPVGEQHDVAPSA